MTVRGETYPASTTNSESFCRRKDANELPTNSFCSDHNTYEGSKRSKFRRFHDDSASHCKCRSYLPCPWKNPKSGMADDIPRKYVPHHDGVIPWDTTTRM